MEKTLKEHLWFERLISEISARFINILPERVDREIENGLKEILEFFQVDRCGLLRASPDRTTWQVTHLALADGIAAVPVKTDLPVALFPWAYKKIVELHEVLAFTSLKELPAEASTDKQTFIAWGIKSTMDIPVITGDADDYFIALNAVRSERIWPEEYIPRLRLLGGVFVNALARAQMRVQLEERMALAAFHAGLSSRFVNVSSEHMEAEIDASLQSIARYLDIERASLSQLSEDEAHMIVTHAWAAPGHENGVGAIASAEAPWIFRKVMRGETVVCSCVDDLPAEAARDKKFLKEAGSRSYSAIPLMSGGKVIGFVGLESLSRQRNWPEKMVGELRSVLQIFANALARKRADQALRESEARLDIAASSAEAGLWILDLRTGNFWATEKARELFGYAKDEKITFERFLSTVHPDDREFVRRAVDQSIRAKENLKVEYRIVPDGESVRWVISRGRPYFSASGEPKRVMGVTLDNTEHKKMQEQLLTAAKKWQTTFDSIQDLVMILDPEYRIQRVNAATVSFLNLPLDQILGRPCTLLMHGTESCMQECPGAKALQTRQHQEAEIFNKGKNVWLLVSADPIVDANGNTTEVVHTMKDITERKEYDLRLKKAYHEIRQLQDQLEAENIYLREEIGRESDFEHIIGTSGVLKNVLRQVEQVAATDSTVLLSGETGTGKELIAQAIHNLSPRRGRLMVKVNCASLPAALIESELFGREKGAYTGALARQIGRFELADRSTLFLDEITELPLDLQAKLLRVLENGEFERLGSPKTMRVDVRLIAATNRDMAEEVHSGRFREDLYYRLNVFPIEVPPLRERLEDIPLLAQVFITEFSEKMGKKIQTVAKKTLEALQRYHWPGNIRELRNVIEHSVIISSGSSLQVLLPQAPAGASFQNKTMEETEYQHIMDVLAKTGWRIKGSNGAAALLGLKPSTLYSRMNKLGIPNRREKVDISSKRRNTDPLTSSP